MPFRVQKWTWLKLVVLAAAAIPSVGAHGATPLVEHGLANFTIDYAGPIGLSIRTIFYAVPFFNEDNLWDKISHFNSQAEDFFNVPFRFSHTIVRDPSVAYNALITNATSEPGLVAATLDFPINPLGPNTAFGELVVELIDENGDGEAFLTANLPSGGLQEAYVRNSTTLEGVLVGLPLGAAVSGPGTHVFSLPSMAGPTPADGDQLVVSTSFLLSPGDTVRLRSQFVIDEGTGIPVAEIPPLPDPDAGPFFNVINVPDAVIGDRATVGSQTQLNVFDGGEIGDEFSAGHVLYDSFDLEMNISGGEVGDQFHANVGAVVNISGGAIGDDFHANAGSVVNISGGTIGNYFQVGQSNVEGAQARANISDGTLKGVSVSNGVVAMSGGHVLAEVLDDYVGVGRDGVFEMSGGVVGVDDQNGISVGGDGLLRMTGGMVTRIDSGTSPISVLGPPRLDIAGGAVGVLRIDRNSVVNIRGGTFEQINALADAVVNISGGEVSGTTGGFRASPGSTINLFGLEFLLDGEEIDGLVRGVPLEIADRDVTLSGMLADGSEFSFAPDTMPFSVNALLTVTLVLPGDYNGDGVVDAADYVVWRNNLGQTGFTPFTGGDGNGDGRVTTEDYAVWKSQYGSSSAGGGGADSTALIPEPASTTLWLLGVVALFWRRSL